MTAAGVQAAVFGRLAIETASARLGPRDLGGVKPKQLLELLLLERGQTLSKESIADRLWGDALPVSLSATVETYVSVLRKRIGQGTIVTAPGGYGVDPARVHLDLDEFDRRLQKGAAGEAADRYPHLEAAAALGREPLLADEPYAEWVLPFRRQYAERRVHALVQLAECCLTLGRHEEAGERAADALTAEPLLERAARSLMLARYAMGDQARALATYAELRAGLADEYGVVPAPETTQLSTAIRNQAEADVLVRAVGGRPAPIRFALNGSVRIAHQTFGSGDPDIVFVPQFLTHLGATWDEPLYAAFLHNLGSLGRVTLFDKRGSGLSDPVLEWPDDRERSDDMRAVLDAAGIDRAVLFGVCDGGVASVRFAVHHPERVSALVLFGTPVRLLADAGAEWGWTDRFYCSFLDAFDAVWTEGDGLEAMDPSIAGNPRYRALFARFLRMGASPGMARRLWEADGRRLDIRSLLPRMTAPALVMTRADDAWVPPVNSRYLAEHLPAARLVEMPGADHEPWLGETEPVIEAVRSFLNTLGAPSEVPARRYG